SHYEKEHGSYMSDEKILKIVKQLDKRNDFTPKLQGKLPGRILLACESLTAIGEKQINKIVRELSDPNLSLAPYSPNQAQDLTNRVADIVSELMNEYNHRVIEIIEKERKAAFQAGLKEGKKHLKLNRK
ncbi:9999_t:CDS:2, partial [Racocetra persica]